MLPSSFIFFCGCYFVTGAAARPTAYIILITFILIFPFYCSLGACAPSVEGANCLTHACSICFPCKVAFKLDPFFSCSTCSIELCYAVMCDDACIYLRMLLLLPPPLGINYCILSYCPCYFIYKSTIFSVSLGGGHINRFRSIPYPYHPSVMRATARPTDGRKACM